jgi:hypothetical protein
VYQFNNPDDPKVMVWCGLLGVMTVDPYFFTKNVDQQRYGKTN